MSSKFLSFLSCELRIIRARNLEFNSKGKLFVRYYLSTGDQGKRVVLKTREISSRSNLSWNETFCLECLGNEESLNELKQQSVVFELRWRSTVPIIGKMRRSRLLGRGEVLWKDVFETENMEMEKLVTMELSRDIGRVHECIKPPSLEVAMKVRAPVVVVAAAEGKKKNLEGCGCEYRNYNGGCECCFVDYDLFALAAVLEGL